MKKFYKIFTACMVSALLAAFCFISAFAAEIDPQLQTELSAYGKQVVEGVCASTEEMIDESIAYYDASGETILAEGFRSLKPIKAVGGELVSTGEPVVEMKEDGTYSIRISCVFENTKCDAVICLSQDLNSITVFSFAEENAESGQSMGKLIKDASVNLVVGMGTVFAVLVFLCWVISLFKYIHAAEEKLNKKKTDKIVEKPVVTITKTSEGSSSEEEIRAVIAAAIAAYESESEGAIVKQGALSNGKIIRSYRR